MGDITRDCISEVLRDVYLTWIAMIIRECPIGCVGSPM